MIIPFWGNDPFILLNKDYIFELLPSSKMTYEQKINSITRLILLLTLLGYIFTFSNRLLIVCLITLSIIYTLYKYKMKKNDNQEENLRRIKEGFHTNDKQITIMDPVSLKKFVKSEFKEGNKKNPFSNVLLTDIMDDPDRNAAPPSFNPQIDETITKNIKKSVQHMNPGIKNTNKQLFSDLTDNFYLDQSNRAFYSTANTRVSNDQGAFGEFLYGNMPSSKESNVGGAIQRVKDSYRYTLY